MAKFKKGDKVTCSMVKKYGVGQVTDVSRQSNGLLEVKWPNGHELMCDVADCKLAVNSLPVSRNSVVANAVAAQGVANAVIAHNGYGSSDGSAFYERFGNDVDVKIIFNKNDTRSAEISVGGMKYGVNTAKVQLKYLKAQADSLSKAIQWVASNYPDAK